MKMRRNLVELFQDSVKTFGNYDVTNMYKKQNNKTISGFVGYLRLYRYASNIDILLILIAVIMTLVRATVLSLNTLLYGDFLNILIDRINGEGTSSQTLILHYFGGGKILTNATREENRLEIYHDSKVYGVATGILGIIHLIASILGIDLFNRTALKQATRIRKNLLRSMMRQEIGWYDVSNENNIAVRINEDVNKIRDGIGEKVGHCLRILFTFLFCITLSFYHGWEVTSMVIVTIPIALVTHSMVTKIQTKLSSEEQTAYAIATNLFEEILNGIRTVIAFCGEEKEVERYDEQLDPARRAATKKGFATGFGEGMARFISFVTTALIYWYGIKFVLDDRDKVDKRYTPAVLTVIFMSVFCGIDNLSRTAPYFESFASAIGSGAIIFKLIDRESKIDPMSSIDKISSFEIKGNIEFRNVGFSYPSRPEIKVLQGLSLKIPAEQTIALVGSSGNGKSTCMQLLQHFYDPDEGNILVDDFDIRNFNISLLRSKMAMVGQEPVLFSTTIAENIRYGNPEATDKDIVNASREAGAHDFIISFPQGYDTLVGEKGCQLSGGQKQRIAIARALIQNPNILLLDEATSALDYESEKVVQAALDRASKGRTTIVVSHRPSAVQSAERIVFIEKGRVVEDGSHDELIASKGRYYEMFSKLESEISTIVSENHHQKESEAIDTAHSYLVDQSSPIKSDKDRKTIETINYVKIIGKILRFSKSEWYFLGVGIFCSISTGLAYPIYSILFGELYGAMSLIDKQQAIDATNYLCIIYLIISITAFFTALCQNFFFSKTAVLLATRLRSTTFNAILKQEIGWFDDKNNGVGVLSARLSDNASGVQEAFGYPICSILQCLSAFIVGVGIAYSYNWKLATACLLPVPVVVALVILEGKHMIKAMDVEKRMMESSTRIATEAILNIRTVASLRQERHMISRYETEIDKVEAFFKKKTLWRGLVSSVSYAVGFLTYNFTLAYGGFLVADKEIPLEEVLIIIEGINYSALLLGWTITFVPSITTAVISAHQLFKIIDRQPNIVSPTIVEQNKKANGRNDIVFEDIDFYYPTRPNIQVLRKLNLTVPGGKVVALVGSSGSGKSTCIQLLQRFYNIQNGHIFIGNDEITTDISLKDLRSKLSIVSQEPILFDRTIAENIAYGYNKNEIEVAMANVIEAAKIANIHDFIVSLPLGYKTNLGSKGAQLSGGQKQRIAIARALIRNPKILLLDEATSALDLESEKIVQQALDVARSGRTCLIIAHRLTTVRNADLIYVLQNGQVREKGTHIELLAANGIYAKLYSSQTFA